MSVEPVRVRGLARTAPLRRELRAALGDGSLTQVLHGVYLPASECQDLVARAKALSLVLPDGAALNRRSAAWLHGIDPRAPSERHEPIELECVTPVGAEPVTRPGVRGWSASVPPGDVVSLAGIPVTSPERTALDLARFEPPHMALACLDRLAATVPLDLEALGYRLEDFCGGRGVAQARRLVRLCDPGAESFGESWTRLRLADAGFPRPETQVWVHDDRGVRRFRLDLAWRARRIAVEYDGEEFHSSPEAVRADAERREWLERVRGWHVVVVGRGEVLGRSLDLERGVGDLFGLEPRIRRRSW